MVILIDRNKHPVGFTTEGHLRRLCEERRAVIYRVFPTVAILKDKKAEDMDGLRTYRIKIDPGAKHTGIAIVCNETDEAVFFMQIAHRGEQIKHALTTRQQARRNRRNREKGYRRCKYKPGREHDCAREKGWFPPSVRSTADNIISWVRKLRRWIAVTECSVEAVRFDTQLMEAPDIEGAAYQHGTLFGYEVKEYLLEKYGHECQYCGGKTGDSILEWEHVRPKSRGGSDSIRNATLSCRTCNKAKGSRTPQEWLALIQSKTDRTALDKARMEGIRRVIAGKPSVPYRYCAWVNSSRKYLEQALFKIFPKVECASGGRTKYNRTRAGLPKDHHYDALCVGSTPKDGYKDRTCGYVLMADAMGRGSRLRGNTNQCGIITVKYRNRQKTCKGFMTGDIVHADVPRGKHQGRYTGRITIRHSGTFGLIDAEGKRHDVNCRYMTVIQKSDGYRYHYERRSA